MFLQSTNYRSLTWSFLRMFPKRVSYASPYEILLVKFQVQHQCRPTSLLSDLTYSNGPVVFSLLTKSCILRLLGTVSPVNVCWNFLRHFITHTHCSAVGYASLEPLCAAINGSLRSRPTLKYVTTNNHYFDTRRARALLRTRKPSLHCQLTQY
jgi:hypothetical protein